MRGAGVRRALFTRLCAPCGACLASDSLPVWPPPPCSAWLANENLKEELKEGAVYRVTHLAVDKFQSRWGGMRDKLVKPAPPAGWHAPLPPTVGPCQLLHRLPPASLPLAHACRGCPLVSPCRRAHPAGRWTDSRPASRVHAVHDSHLTSRPAHAHGWDCLTLHPSRSNSKHSHPLPASIPNLTPGPALPVPCPCRGCLALSTTKGTAWTQQAPSAAALPPELLCRPVVGGVGGRRRGDSMKMQLVPPLGCAAACCQTQMARRSPHAPSPLWRSPACTWVCLRCRAPSQARCWTTQGCCWASASGCRVGAAGAGMQHVACRFSPQAGHLLACDTCTLESPPPPPPPPRAPAYASPTSPPRHPTPFNPPPPLTHPATVMAPCRLQGRLSLLPVAVLCGRQPGGAAAAGRAGAAAAAVGRAAGTAGAAAGW